MSNVDVQGDPNNPTSMLTQTRSGDAIDLQNITGRRKLELISTGEMEIDQFVVPPNMPGHKLKELRAHHRSQVEEQLKTLIKGKDAKDYGVGDFVSFRGGSYEILKVRADGVMLNLKLKDEDEAKNVWVPKEKVKKG
jgi:hypothetical protein